jgi:Spy/CpxP family protein refolding chaperone
MLAALALAAPLFGQQTEKRARPGRGNDTAAARRERPQRRQSDREGEPMRELIGTLNLSDEQRQQVQQIMETHRQAIENWRSENGDKLEDLHKQMAEARKAGEKEKIEELREKVRALIESRKALNEQMMKQLGEVLTEEQMAKLREALNAGKKQWLNAHPRIAAAGALGKLGLSDEQKQQVAEILRAAREKAAQTEDRDAKREILQAAMEKIRTDVLTEEQRQKLDEMREKFQSEPGERIAHALRRLGLSKDQQDQIAAIMAKAREDAKAAEGREAKAEGMKAAWEKIRTDVLTEEQREKLGQRHQRIHDRKGERGESEGDTGRAGRRGPRRERPSRPQKPADDKGEI